MDALDLQPALIEAALKAQAARKLGDYHMEILRRARFALELQGSPERQRAVLLVMAADPISFVNDWIWTYNPRNISRNLPPVVPFVLRPTQERLIRWLQEREATQSHGMVEKSRDEGMSYVVLAYFLHRWLFTPGFAAGVGSRKEEYVDRKGDPKSLFWKFRDMLGHLPGWMMPAGFSPKLHDNHMRILNPANGASLNGEAGDNIGRGGRTIIYLLVGAGPTLPGQGRVVPADLPAFAGAIVSQALQTRNDAQADRLVDYCDRWVRDTLGDAAPKVRSQIDKLFRDGAPSGVASAQSSQRSPEKAQLTNKYTSANDLTPSDVVFYTENGQNHTGVYLGNNVVRGNNRVTYQDNGGRFGPGGINGGKALDTGKVNPVGDVDINRLGTVNSFVRSGDLLAYLQRVSNQVVTPQPGRQAKEKASEPTPTPGAPPPDAPTPLKDTLNARLKQAQATFDLVDKNSKDYQKAVTRYLATLSNVQRLAFDAAMKLPESDAGGVDLAGIVKSTRDKISGLAKTGGAVEALKKQIEDARAVFQLYTKETPGHDKALDAYLAVLRKAATESQNLARTLPAGDKKNALSGLFTSTRARLTASRKRTAWQISSSASSKMPAPRSSWYPRTRPATKRRCSPTLRPSDGCRLPLKRPFRARRGASRRMRSLTSCQAPAPRWTACARPEPTRTRSRRSCARRARRVPSRK